MPKRSDFREISDKMQMVRFRFDDGRESVFVGVPLPPDYGKIEAIEFSALLQLPDNMRMAVRHDGVVAFVDPATLTDDDEGAPAAEA